MYYLRFDKFLLLFFTYSLFITKSHNPGVYCSSCVSHSGFSIIHFPLCMRTEPNEEPKSIDIWEINTTAKVIQLFLSWKFISFLHPSEQRNPLCALPPMQPTHSTAPKHHLLQSKHDWQPFGGQDKQLENVLVLYNWCEILLFYLHLQLLNSINIFRSFDKLGEEYWFPFYYRMFGGKKCCSLNTSNDSTSLEASIRSVI